jgi:hypothetical protein
VADEKFLDMLQGEVSVLYDSGMNVPVAVEVILDKYRARYRQSERPELRTALCSRLGALGAKKAAALARARKNRQGATQPVQGSFNFL